ncbi:MAG: M23 family metallopeptidase [Leptolyngbyaceae cyanobacterium CRU_2_3]|nr:M23 family metallopeptidase [Leptolyngbyaceae cyanobacterium CRU_2_3]
MNVSRSLRSADFLGALENLSTLTLFGLLAIPLLTCLSSPAVADPSSPASDQDNLCQQPVLSRLTRHRIVSGETIASIAQQYNLIPATLLGFNPVLRNGSTPIGTEILVPPYNGVRVDVPTDSSWRDIAKSYGVRADVLFEINGCQEAPRVVFVPGINWAPATTSASTASTSDGTADPLIRSPLSSTATILQGYGWQLEPTTGKVIFNSGIDLETATETQVLATGAGTIAFAGEQGNSKMVVINHSQGLQTRYTQLASLAVRVGQQVQAGAQIGAIGTGSTSARLHFEVRSNSNLGWVAQDPGNYIPELKRSDRGRETIGEGGTAEGEPLRNYRSLKGLLPIALTFFREYQCSKIDAEGHV